MFSADKSDLLTAAKEGMQVYHAVRHNQSFQSMQCTSEILRFVYNQQDFSCSTTKATTILTGVFEPMNLSQIQNEMSEAQFVCIATDTSSRKEITMYPVIARYFLPLEGIRTRLIDFSNMYRETGADIFDVLKLNWEKWDIRKKIKVFLGDNCRTNFGNSDRQNGKLNVFARLRTALGDDLIGIGCIAHILHNTPQNACSAVLPYDIQNVLTLIYKQFYNSTKQTEALKQICEELSVDFTKVKGCPRTRFLAKKNSISSVLKMFAPLTEYFTSNPTKKVPVTLKKFFADPLSKFYLIIVRDLCETFEDAILKIEGNQTTGYEAMKTVDSVYRTLETILAVDFMPIDAEDELRKICQLDPYFDETSVFDTIRPIYGKTIVLFIKFSARYF